MESKTVDYKPNITKQLALVHPDCAAKAHRKSLIANH
jgi:hypothetical protein